MTKNKATLLGALLLALVLAVGLSVYFSTGDSKQTNSASSSAPATSTSPSASPTEEPITLTASAKGGENKASFTITSNRAATGNLVLKAGGKTVKTIPFTTSKTAKGFTATVTAKKLAEGVLTWALQAEDLGTLDRGKVTITRPAPVKDGCPNGDYTGNTYDGRCGTKPVAPKPAPVKQQDYCPNGDYTGTRYDGHCGSKPAPSKPAKPSGGGHVDPKPHCDKNHVLVGPDDFGHWTCWTKD